MKPSTIQTLPFGIFILVVSSLQIDVYATKFDRYQPNTIFISVAQSVLFCFFWRK